MLDMENRFNIHTIITDEQRKIHLFVRTDTIANRVYIYHAKPENDTDEAIEKLFDEKVNYHLNISSDFVIRLVDELGGISIDGKKTDGKTALELIRNDQLDDVVNAVSNTLENKNLIKVIPSLLSSLSDTYSMDIAVMDIIKTLWSEIRELKDWKIELVR